jgi:tripartite-type tricarboxylate transporter receptor subunit TctC
MMRALLAAALCAGLAVHAAAPADAQAYPSRPIKVVVPFPPGGPTDGMARIISDRLGAVLGQPIVVENKGGAGGGIGGKFVAEAEPDGYTILMSPGGSLTTGPVINPNIGYDPARALRSVAQLVEMPIIVAVNPDLPVNSMAEVVSYAKANPGKLKWGSQGFGTAPHLLIELFKLENDVNIVHVPYRGTGPMLNGILGGEVQIVADPSTTVLPHIQAGKLRPIAVGSRTRIPELPDVPTIAESGFKDYEIEVWYAVFAPARTPGDVMSRVSGWFRDASLSPAIRGKLVGQAFHPVGQCGAEFAAYLKSEDDKFGRAVRDANIRQP